MGEDRGYLFDCRGVRSLTTVERETEVQPMFAVVMIITAAIARR